MIEGWTCFLELILTIRLRKRKHVFRGFIRYSRGRCRRRGLEGRSSIESKINDQSNIIKKTRVFNLKIIDNLINFNSGLYYLSEGSDQEEDKEMGVKDPPSDWIGKVKAGEEWSRVKGILLILLETT